MKNSIEEYVGKLEARARKFIKAAQKDHIKFYPIALELCRVIGDFTGEERWDAYDRIQHALHASQAA